MFVGFPGHPHPYAMAAMFAAMTGNGGFFANQMGQAPPPGCMVNLNGLTWILIVVNNHLNYFGILFQDYLSSTKKKKKKSTKYSAHSD